MTNRWLLRNDSPDNQYLLDDTNMAWLGAAHNIANASCVTCTLGSKSTWRKLRQLQDVVSALVGSVVAFDVLKKAGNGCQVDLFRGLARGR